MRDKGMGSVIFQLDDSALALGFNSIRDGVLSGYQCTMVYDKILTQTVTLPVSRESLKDIISHSRFALKLFIT